MRRVLAVAAVAALLHGCTRENELPAVETCWAPQVVQRASAAMRDWAITDVAYALAEHWQTGDAVLPPREELARSVTIAPSEYRLLDRKASSRSLTCAVDLRIKVVRQPDKVEFTSRSELVSYHLYPSDSGWAVMVERANISALAESFGDLQKLPPH